MGGPSKAEKKQVEISDQQLGIAKSAEARSQEQYERFSKDVAPAETFYSAVTKGGKSMLSAIAPLVTRINQGRSQTKEAIYDQLPAGPARDLAVAESERKAYGDVAAVKNSSFMEALDKLANIGSGLGSFSLQNTGAALSGTAAAGNTNSAILQREAAAKAARMGLIGDIAGAGGMAIGGKLAR